jgi:hypothetical protein
VFLERRQAEFAYSVWAAAPTVKRKMAATTCPFPARWAPQDPVANSNLQQVIASNKNLPLWPAEVKKDKLS